MSKIKASPLRMKEQGLIKVIFDNKETNESMASLVHDEVHVAKAGFDGAATTFVLPKGANVARWCSPRRGDPAIRRTEPSGTTSSFTADASRSAMCVEVVWVARREHKPLTPSLRTSSFWTPTSGEITNRERF